MRYLFYLAHPAHFHLFKFTIEGLKNAGHQVLITIKSKDVLASLLDENGLEYRNIAINERGNSKTGILTAFIRRNINHWKITSEFKPDIFVSTSAEFAPFAKLKGIKSISMFEDDLEIFPAYSRLFVPFLDHQLCPESCSAAQWNNHPKTIKYKGNHELAYLRPERFSPDYNKVISFFDADRKNFFIRFARLTAWHDENVKGIHNELAIQLVTLLSRYGKVHLSSERELPAELEKFRVKIPSSDILHVLAFADLYIGDSQTMTAEAAVLGTPAIRFNDFVGKLGYLDELEFKYGLTKGIPANQPEELIKKAEEWASSDLKIEWNNKRNKLLAETIDPSSFFTWFLSGYPETVSGLKINSGKIFNPVS